MTGDHQKRPTADSAVSESGAFEDMLSNIESSAESMLREAEDQSGITSRSIPQPDPASAPSDNLNSPPVQNGADDELLDEIDEDARRRFEADWNAGRAQPVESYLPPPSNPVFLATAEELVHIDLEYGWKLYADTGDCPQRFGVESYVQRIPPLNEPAALIRLVEQEYRVRHRFGDRPDAESVRDRFPELVTLAQIENWEIREQRVDETANLLRPDRMLGNFQLVGPIGRGGMGEVWKAFDTVGDRDVVVKFVPPELRRYPDELARVRATFKQVHALQHQHICPTYLLDEDPELGVYLVMKYLDGTTLAGYHTDLINRQGEFPLAEAVRVLRPVALALDYAHSHKLIHRDIKPANVMISRDGSDVQVVDFGLVAEFRTSISRISQQRMDSSGTYPYMAPEQWRGQYQNAATDQYALGVVAYELLAGRVPFECFDEIVLRQCVLEECVPQLEHLSDATNQVLRTALAKQRSERYPNCVEFVECLAQTV